MRSWNLAAALAATLFLALPPAAVCARDNALPYSQDDVVRLFGEVCGRQPQPGKLRIHRSSAGDFLYIITPSLSEAVVYARNQACNTLSTQTIDLWRSDKGVVVAQLLDDDGKPLLLVDDAEIRGKKFDVDRSGQYLMVSHGDRSTISGIAKPYRTLLDLPINGQRVFARKRGLLVVGDNTKSGQLEAHVVAIGPQGLTDQGPLPLKDLSAGLKVYDYLETADELLVGGIDASGQPAFAVYNLTSGEARGVVPEKPGCTEALFVRDNALRGRLQGAGAAPTAPTGQEQPRKRFPFGN